MGPVVKPIIEQLPTVIPTAIIGVKAVQAPEPQSVALSNDSSNELVPLETVTELVVDILTVRVSSPPVLSTMAAAAD